MGCIKLCGSVHTAQRQKKHKFTLGCVLIDLYQWLPRSPCLFVCRTVWTHQYFGISDHEEKSREKASTAVKSELELSSQTAEPVASSSSPTVQESQAPGIPVAPEPEIEIAINNVVCSFSVRCHLNLRKVATEGMNVIYKRENGVRAWSYEAIVAAIYLLIHTYNTYKKYKNLCVSMCSRLG